MTPDAILRQHRQDLLLKLIGRALRVECHHSEKDKENGKLSHEFQVALAEV
jgi:hypothetical protein